MTISETFGLIALFAVAGIFAITADYFMRYRKTQRSFLRRALAFCGEVFFRVFAISFAVVAGLNALKLFRDFLT